MAKKTRKQKQRSAGRHPAGAAHQLTAPAARTAPGSVGSAAPATSLRPPMQPGHLGAPPAELQGGEGGRRRVGRVGPVAVAEQATGRQQRAPLRSARFGTAAAMVEPLDSDDPAIPFDRVPYVPSDLRRVALIATAMVVLILIAWAIVSNVVH
ncbi:MAG: hypothetical protein ACLQT7_04220 [Candidatus Dormibacteria bacterium]